MPARVTGSRIHASKVSQNAKGGSGVKYPMHGFSQLLSVAATIAAGSTHGLGATHSPYPDGEIESSTHHPL